MNSISNRHAAASIFAFGIGLAACTSGGGTGGGSGGDNGSAGSGGDTSGTGGSGNSSGDGGTTGTGGTGDGGTGGGAAQTGGAGGAATGGTVGKGGTVGTGGASGGAPGKGGGTPATGGSGGVAVPVACGARPYCQDFEGITAGQRPPGAGGLSRATMAVAEDKAFSGARSLKITSQSGGNSSAWVNVSPGAKLTNPKKLAYARMMVWMDQLPLFTGGDPGHWGFVSMQGTASNGAQTFSPTIRFGGGSGDESMWLYYGQGGFGVYDCTFRTVPNQLPLKKWACVEMVINEDDLFNYMVNIDAVEVAALSVISTEANFICSGNPGTKNWYIPKPTSFNYGWEYVHTQGRPVTLYIDDVIIDQVPIGCPAGNPSKP